MSIEKITTRPARAVDIIGHYGQTPPTSVRAWVLEIDGEVRGLAGYRIEDGRFVVFSDVDPDVPKMTIWRKAKEFMSMLKFPAYCQCTETSGPFLERLGWQHIGGIVYSYVPKGVDNA